MVRNRINPALAAELKKRMTWRQIGEELARRQGRAVPYTEEAVSRVVKAWKAKQGG